VNIGSWIKEHKAATAAIVIGGVGILYLLSSGSGGSGGSGDSASQIAELNANAQAQQASVQAQQNEAQIQANAQTEQTEASVQANQDTIAGQVAETAIAAQSTNYGTGVQGDILEDLINTGEQEQVSQNQLSGEALNDQFAVVNQASSAISTESGKKNLIQANENTIATALGEGNVGSYNSANASEAIANTLETGSILGSIIKGGSSIISGLL
jgi:hypothetical protein